MSTDVVQAVAMILVGGLALATVLTREPLYQAMVYSLFGATLAVLFLVVQAPDVSLSEIVVGAVAWPAMVLFTLAKARHRDRRSGRVRERPR
ncbi:MAG: Na(+)/H(+) antiporter subunit B [Actinomycetota bacterium]